MEPESKTGASLPLSHEERVDRLCDQFESAYRNGQQPRIEDYLVQAPEGAVDHLLRELISLELDLDRQAGKAADIEDYRQRFPNRLDVIEAAFELADEIGDVSTAGPHSEHDTQLELEAGEEHPAQIDRYAIERVLGRGGFAVVYLAHDPELDRKVALKVPRADRFRSSLDLDQFSQEARHGASLDHPGIVRVYDVRRDSGSVFIVQQYIEGQDLGDYLQKHRCSPQEIAYLMVRIAEAVGVAHQAGLYHRDLKPRNILIDKSGNPHVADFGLAVHVARQREHRGELAGSYPYMAPEQVRGEVNRLDGRTDIWALGVILYELLTGTRPFVGRNPEEVFDEIKHRDPRPPRQMDPSIPRELSRICLACLAKRASDRYDATADLIDDLQHWLSADQDTESPSESDLVAQQQSSALKPAIVPKGLRCFDATDADFFLELLPGPCDRDGLPKSVRFWKTRIEETRPERTFAVGLMYGPSGCGKSSLVQAGTLPRLAKHVLPIYVEATADDTEVRLIKTLRSHLPEFEAERSLPELVVALRDRHAGGGQKVLLVLDQFEQWLHSQQGDPSQLVAALRQCDGRHVQAVLMVRDDFWMAITRFMRELEVKIVEGHNSSAVDLFDLDHARHVLIAFGRAYGKLSETELTVQENAFVDAAVTDLAESGKVVSVRLAMFAEMMKVRSWTLAALRDVGGAEGIGVTFLDETFDARTAPPPYRLHGSAIRAVLKELLPEHGTDIRGQMKSYEQLLEASGYAGSPADFDGVLDILDGEVRLITPTEPDQAGGNTGLAAGLAAKHYQLTHDYLVPSLRDWLTKKQKETRRGRAELRLAELAEHWRLQPERRNLPTPFEFVQIGVLTRRNRWSPTEREMMQRGRRLYGSYLLLGLAIVLTVGWTAKQALDRNAAHQLIKGLSLAQVSSVPKFVRDLRPYRRWAESELQRLVNSPDVSPKEEVRYRQVLSLWDSSHVDFLHQQLLAIPPDKPDEFFVLRDHIASVQAQRRESLWSCLEDETDTNQRRFLAACALAAYEDTKTPQQIARWERVVEFLARQQIAWISNSRRHTEEWSNALRGIRNKLWEPLKTLHRDTNRSWDERYVAGEVLSYHDTAFLVNLLVFGGETEFDTVLARIGEQRSTADLIGKELARLAKTGDNGESVAQDMSVLSTALMRLGKPEAVWTYLRNGRKPQLQSHLIHFLAGVGTDPTELLQELLIEEDDGVQGSLLLALGEFADKNRLGAEFRAQYLPVLLELYKTHAHKGVHAAAEWTLRKWGVAARISEIDDQLAKRPVSEDTEWYPTKEGFTMVRLGPADFLMGSPHGEPGRTTFEGQHRCRIPRRFAIATKEVTVEQFDRFFSEVRAKSFEAYMQTSMPDFSLAEYAPSPDCPQTNVPWDLAAQYCNWLSKREGIPENQWCYSQVANTMKSVRGCYNRTGYRLPTEAEWEYACRAGTTTSRCFGESDELLAKYAWYEKNSTCSVGSLKPNAFGLFDMHGNVWEWCNDEWTNHHTTDTDTQKPDSPAAQSRMTQRGGSFFERARDVRSATRGADRVKAFRGHYGFRIARTIRMIES